MTRKGIDTETSLIRNDSIHSTHVFIMHSSAWAVREGLWGGQLWQTIRFRGY